MPRIAALLAAAALFFAAACEKHASVLPTDPGGNPGAPTMVITIATDRGSLDAGSTQPATLTVSARLQNGSPVTDGTDVTINTSLGHFGVDTTGKPITITTAKLAGGNATLPFYAGTETGTANLLAQIGTSVGRLNITITQPPAAPVADFAFEASGLSVLFTDLTMGTVTKRTWDFGDGTTSDAQNPKHDYAAAGSYAVKLTVENGGGTSSKSKFVTVSGGPPLVAAFKAEASGLTVLFTDQSTGGATAWQWDFGDGTPFDTTQNPRHVYARAGTYTVTLTVRNASGASASASAFVTVGGAAPQADFKFEVAGLKVNFTDASTGSPTSWSWNFGDCNISTQCTSTEQNPTHTYEVPGTYNVTLTATNLGGATSKSQFVTVSRGTPPTAAFTFQVVGLQVAFTDKSTGAPTAWEWDFGDNTARDTRQNPTHTYTAAGTYLVTLKVTNEAGTSSVSQFVKAVSPPVANFSFTVASANTLAVNFVDESTGSPESWAWNFGDCATSQQCTSTAQNPSHVYVEPGVYTVVLTVTNAAGSSTKRRDDVAVGAPKASFSTSINGRAVTFTDTSTNNPTQRLWNFGDCGLAPACTSTSSPTTHTYTAAGTYFVTLTVRNEGGQDTITQPVTVQ